MDEVYNMLNSHPLYFEIFKKLHSYIMSDFSSPSIQMKYFLALMAVSRHKCFVLIYDLKNEFIKNNGFLSWLESDRNLPLKLIRLKDVNKILAHRAWCLKPNFIEELNKGNDCWNLPELILVMILFAHFHCLCSFVNASFVFQKIKIVQIFHPQRTNSDEKSTVKLLQTMQKLSCQNDDLGPVDRQAAFKDIQETNEVLTTNISENITNSTEIEKNELDFLFDDPSYTYEDFSKRSEQCTTFRIQDYSWQEHGFSLMSQFQPDLANLLDEKFITASTLTYNTLGCLDDVDTYMFRNAIWKYVQSLYGIRHDDFDYRQINLLLDIPLKRFIKTACCSPDLVQHMDMSEVMSGFHISEKIHVIIMVFEARFQAELLYILRAVAQYITI